MNLGGATLRLKRLLHRARRRLLPMTDAGERRLAQILQTPAIFTEPLDERQAPAAQIGVHVLCQDAHLLRALWTLKSFYHFAGVRYPLTVHLQGSNTLQMGQVFPQHFPQARLISQEAADATVEPWLQEQGLQRLLAMRRQFFLMMKLIDLRLFSRTLLTLYFDTDVLFFRRPHELMTPPANGATPPHLFMRDRYPSYCITPDQARSDLGVDLTPFANAGLMRLVTAGIDLGLCEQFLAHPALAQTHWHLEQTLHALYASAHSRLELLPEAAYALTEGPQPDIAQLVARHYVSPVRPLLIGEGVAYLTGTGFLAALAHGRAGTAADAGLQAAP